MINIIRFFNLFLQHRRNLIRLLKQNKQNIRSSHAKRPEPVQATPSIGLLNDLPHGLAGVNRKQTIVATFTTKLKYVADQIAGGQDCYEKKLISVEKVHTDLNVADLLTKPFDGPRFNYLVVSIETNLDRGHSMVKTYSMLQYPNHHHPRPPVPSTSSPQLQSPPPIPTTTQPPIHTPIPLPIPTPTPPPIPTPTPTPIPETEPWHHLSTSMRKPSPATNTTSPHKNRHKTYANG
ncbi:hypothetical protein Tco_0157896 [Tanacetum coccineum]